jgi:hypothetical protein
VLASPRDEAGEFASVAARAMRGAGPALRLRATDMRPRFPRRHRRPDFAAVSALEQKRRGRREGRVSTDTHGPRAKKCTGQEPQAQPDDPAFPARWRYGLYVISPGTGSFAPVTRDARHEHHGLDLSTGRPGPHDFAVRDHRARHRATVPSTASRAQRP